MLTQVGAGRYKRCEPQIWLAAKEFLRLCGVTDSESILMTGKLKEEIKLFDCLQ